MLNAKPLGIIDTLGEGFASLHRRLWILLLPVALDLLFAFGPGVSAAPVLNRDLGAAGDMVVAAGEDGADSSSLRTLLDGYRDVNVLGVLSWQLPSVMAVTSQTALPKITGAVFSEVENGAALLGLGAVLAALGLAGASLYLAALAQGVRRDLSVSKLPGSAARAFIRLVALFGMLFVVGIPMTVLAVLVTAFTGAAAAMVLRSALLTIMLLAAFYAFFLDDAIVLGDLWPLPAAIASAKVVRRHFWQSLLFIVAVTLIGAGMPLVWRQLMDQLAGQVVAIVGHAYISSGLAAAAMFFFWQRYQTLPQSQLSGVQIPRSEA